MMLFLSNYFCSLFQSLLLVAAGPVLGEGGQEKYVPRRRMSPTTQPRTASVSTPSSLGSSCEDPRWRDEEELTVH